LRIGKEAGLGAHIRSPTGGARGTREASNKNYKTGKEKGRALAAVLPLLIHTRRVLPGYKNENIFNNKLYNVQKQTL